MDILKYNDFLLLENNNAKAKVVLDCEIESYINELNTVKVLDNGGVFRTSVFVGYKIEDIMVETISQIKMDVEVKAEKMGKITFEIKNPDVVLQKLESALAMKRDLFFVKALLVSKTKAFDIFLKATDKDIRGYYEDYCNEAFFKNIEDERPSEDNVKKSFEKFVKTVTDFLWDGIQKVKAK